MNQVGIGIVWNRSECYGVVGIGQKFPLSLACLGPLVARFGCDMWALFECAFAEFSAVEDRWDRSGGKLQIRG